MRRARRWALGLGLALLVAAPVCWRLARATTDCRLDVLAGDLAALQASVPSIEQRCAGRVASARALSRWAERLVEAERGAPAEDEELDATLAEFDSSPLDAWRAKGWALDDASWTREAARLERCAAASASTSAVFRTVAEYDALDPCSLIAGLAPPRHPTLANVDPSPGLRAVAFSLLAAARRGDLARVADDIEASLALAEQLYVPASAELFALWALAANRMLDELEGALPLVGARVDLTALGARLEPFDPTAFLSESLVWEEAYGLETFEWFAEQERPTSVLGATVDPLVWNSRVDLALWREGFDLLARRLRERSVSDAELAAYEERLREGGLLSAMLMPPIGDLERAVRAVETHLALARTALRIAQHGRDGWESVPRELDPWTGTPLDAELRDDGRVVLHSSGPERAPEENAEPFDWIVVLR